MRCNWKRVYEGIAEELRRQRVAAISDSLDELFRRSSGDQEPEDLRHRELWSECQRGVPAYTTLRDAGLVVNFTPDIDGELVTDAMFRLNGRV